MKHTRRQQLKVHLANKARRDKTRHRVIFQPGDLVLFFDHTYDTEGVSKFQWLYSGPNLIERKCAQSDNLYWIRRTDKGKRSRLEKVNVNRLCLADTDCGPLGPPLGWGKDFGQPRNQPTQLPEAPINSNNFNAVVGDMVALMMEPDPNEPLPFAVGEIIHKKESKICCHWFGQTRKNASMLGTWKGGYVDTGDNLRYYHDRKMHKSPLLYTSTLSESKLDIEYILCQPFLLTNRNKIPPLFSALSLATRRLIGIYPRKPLMPCSYKPHNNKYDCKHVVSCTQPLYTRGRSQWGRPLDKINHVLFVHPISRGSLAREM
jgi:hypothetical protein